MSQTLDLLLKRNPNTKSLLEQINHQGYKYPFITLTSVGILKVSDLPDKGKEITDEVLAFFNSKDLSECVQSQWRHVVPMAKDGTHLVGYLLSAVHESLLGVAEGTSHMEIPFDKLENIDYSPIIKVYKFQANVNGYEGQVLRGEIDIPLSTIRKEINLNSIGSKLALDIMNYIKEGKFIPIPKISDCDKYKTGLDLKLIQDVPLNPDQLIQVSSQGVKTDGEKITFTYRITPTLRAGVYSMTTDMFEFYLPNTDDAVAKGLVCDYQKNIKRSLPAAKSDIEQEGYRKERISQEEMLLDDIFAEITKQLIDKLELQLENAYKTRLAVLQAQYEASPSPERSFNLGAFSLFTDRSRAAQYIEEALGNSNFGEAPQFNWELFIHI